LSRSDSHLTTFMKACPTRNFMSSFGGRSVPVVEIEKGIAVFLKVRNVTSRQCEASNVRHGQSHCYIVHLGFGRDVSIVYARLRLEAGPFCSIRAYFRISRIEKNRAR
jgi:hypothetical protein